MSTTTQHKTIINQAKALNFKNSKRKSPSRSNSSAKQTKAEVSEYVNKFYFGINKKELQSCYSYMLNS